MQQEVEARRQELSAKEGSLAQAEAAAEKRWAKLTEDVSAKASPAHCPSSLNPCCLQTIHGTVNGNVLMAEQLEHLPKMVVSSTHAHRLLCRVDDLALAQRAQHCHAARVLRVVKTHTRSRSAVRIQSTNDNSTTHSNAACMTNKLCMRICDMTHLDLLRQRKRPSAVSCCLDDWSGSRQGMNVAECGSDQGSPARGRGHEEGDCPGGCYPRRPHPNPGPPGGCCC